MIWTTSTKTLTLLSAFVMQDFVSSFAPQNTAFKEKRFFHTQLHQIEDSNSEGLKGNAKSRDPRNSEFFELEQLSESTSRRERLAKERLGKERFVKYGNEMWDLNDRIEHLSQELIDTLSEGGGDQSRAIREKLREEEQRDPNIVYGLELEAMERALGEEDLESAQVHRQLALDAREHLAQYNYQGLWIGK